MNVIVSNEQQAQIATLDIDVIKSITGAYTAIEIVEMFKNFFYSKMILDVTSIKNYNDIQMFRTISEGLDVEKIVFFIPEGSSICTPNFLAQLVTLGIYNFTTNIDGVKYLLKKSNTYKDVEHIQQMGGGMLPPVSEVPTAPSDFGNQVAPPVTNTPQPQMQIEQGSLTRSIRIGIKNVTDHAGATSLIYMFKKELAPIFGENQVIAIEVNKNDFQYYNDKTMISTSANDLKSVMDRYFGVSLILIDLNDFDDNTFYDDIIYLVEPSTLKLNKLIRRDKNIFKKIKDRKIILNQSLLNNKDVGEFEYEAGIKVFYNLPPVNDRQKNEVIVDFLAKLGIIQVSNRKH